MLSLTHDFSYGSEGKMDLYARSFKVSSQDKWSKINLRMLLARGIKVLQEFGQDITLVKRFATLGSLDLECRHKP